MHRALAIGVIAGAPGTCATAREHRSGLAPGVLVDRDVTFNGRRCNLFAAAYRSGHCHVVASEFGAEGGIAMYEFQLPACGGHGTGCGQDVRCDCAQSAEEFPCDPGGEHVEITEGRYTPAQLNAFWKSNPAANVVTRNGELWNQEQTERCSYTLSSASGGCDVRWDEWHGSTVYDSEAFVAVGESIELCGHRLACSCPAPRSPKHDP